MKSLSPNMICIIDCPDDKYHNRLVKLACDIIYNHWEVALVREPDVYLVCHEKYLKEYKKNETKK